MSNPPLPAPKYPPSPRASAKQMRRAYSVALSCALVPLFSGAGVFLLWLLTRWDALMHAGIMIILLGVVLIIPGGLMLAEFCTQASLSQAISRRRMRLQALAGAALLLANFPVCWVITEAVMYAETTYVVVIENHSSHQFTQVRVYGGGCDAELGPLPPNGKIRRGFHFGRDDALHLQVSDGTTNQTTLLEGYVTNGMGGYTTATIEPDHTITVHNRFE